MARKVLSACASLYFRTVFCLLAYLLCFLKCLYMHGCSKLKCYLLDNVCKLDANSLVGVCVCAVQQTSSCHPPQSEAIRPYCGGLKAFNTKQMCKKRIPLNNVWTVSSLEPHPIDANNNTNVHFQKENFTHPVRKYSKRVCLKVNYGRVCDDSFLGFPAMSVNVRWCLSTWPEHKIISYLN